MALTYGTIKCFDYSVFGIIKEMLYQPLKVEEKFKAKAIIDVFTYRSAKAVASLIILLLQYLFLKNILILLFSAQYFHLKRASLSFFF